VSTRFFAATIVAAVWVASAASAQTPWRLSDGDYVQPFPADINGAGGWNPAEATVAYRTLVATPAPDPAGYTTDAGRIASLVADFPNLNFPNTPTSVSLGAWIEIFEFTATTGDGTGILLAPAGDDQVNELSVLLDSSGRRNLRFDLTLVEGWPDTQGDATIAQLQYRVGAAGAFSNVPGGRIEELNPTKTLGAVSTFGALSGAGGPIALPALLDDRSLIEIRLVISSPEGSREGILIDDLIVTSEPMPAAPGGPVPGSLPQWAPAVALLVLLTASLAAAKRRSVS